MNDQRDESLPHELVVVLVPARDEFHEAVMALHGRNDIAPLQAFLRSDRPLSSANRENLARLIELLHARGQPRKAGKPGGKHLRWTKPVYVAVFLIEKVMDAWKQKHSKPKVPNATKEKFVDEMIGEMEKWPRKEGERFDKARIKARIQRLLHDPKDSRL